MPLTHQSAGKNFSRIRDGIVGSQLNNKDVSDYQVSNDSWRMTP